MNTRELLWTTLLPGIIDQGRIRRTSKRCECNLNDPAEVMQLLRVLAFLLEKNWKTKFVVISEVPWNCNASFLLFP